MNPNISIELFMFFSLPQLEILEIIKYHVSISPWPWPLTLKRPLTLKMFSLLVSP
jgi:hypothetical protein